MNCVRSGGCIYLFGYDGSMTHDDEPLDPPPALHDTEAWCTDEMTARFPGESDHDWMMRMLVTADDHGDG